MTSRKRGQGEGSIFQRRSDGRWSAAVSLGGGRRKAVYARTADEVREKLNEVRQKIAEGQTDLDDRRTVASVFDAWLAAKEGTVRPKTLERYAQMLRHHAVPSIGKVKLSKLKVGHLESMYRDRSPHASPKTLRNLHAVVQSSLAWAVRREWIGRNPAALITTDDLPRVERRSVRVLSPEEVRRLMQAAKGTDSEAFITFAIATGARVGEIMGLTWDRLDLETGRVRITHALQYIGGKPTLVEPKTKSGIRELALPKSAVAVLRAHRARQNEWALSLGKAWSNGLGLVFTRSTGAPLNRHAVLRQYLRPLLPKAGLPKTLRVHDLRHGAASLMLAQGVPVPVVSQMLGHANPSITMSIYSHALPDSQDLVAMAMEAVLSEPL